MKLFRLIPTSFEFIKTFSDSSGRLIIPRIVLPSFTRNVRLLGNIDFRVAIVSIRFCYLHPMPDTSFRIDRGTFRICYRRGYLHIYETYKTTEARRRKKNNLSLHENRRGVLGSFRLPFRVSLCVTPCSRVCRNIMPSRDFMFSAALYKLYFLTVARRRKRMGTCISIDHASHYHALIID